MIRHVTDYFARLAAEFGQGWTRFWFTPSDPAMLCLIRLLTGLVVVYLHATLAFDLIAFFGPNGLLPWAEIAPLEGGTFSYLDYLSQPGDLWAAHLAGLAILVMYAAGLWTRLTSVLALAVFLSDIHRAPMITSRTESIAAMVMLYLCLAPCGLRFSIDRLWARCAARTLPTPAEPAGKLSTAATIATRLIQVHLALLIAMMGFSKLTGEVWWNGTGVWWLIARQESRLVDLSWLYDSPNAIAIWTHVVVFFELTFGVLVWIPLARPLLLALGVAVWGSLALVTGETPFALMLCIASLAFVSPAVFGACCDRSGQSAARVA